MGKKIFYLLIMISLVFIGCNNVYNSDSSSDPKPTYDYLFLMYMDADNNLEGPMTYNLIQVGQGLYNIRNSDGSAKDGYASVKVVALWDGLGNGNSALYEVNASNIPLNTKTTDVSSTASWLSSGEVNMGSPDTLKNFLSWAFSRYSAKNTILQFSNHGGGPRSINATSTVSKALCWDDTSGEDECLYSKDLSDVFYALNLSSSKLGMIVMDVCLGASVEDAYQFRNYAKYLAASPNSIPGEGLNYIALMKAFTSNSTLESIGKQIVTDYKTQYHKTDKNTGWSASELQKIYNWNSSYSSTFSFIDLSKMEDVKDAIDDFATEIKDKKTNFAKYLLYYEDNSDYDSDKDTPTCSNTLSYDGTYAVLNDIGYFATKVYYASTDTSDGGEKDCAKAVIDSMKDAVISAWRNAPDETYNGSLYEYICNDETLDTDDILDPDNIPFGLTITCYYTETGYEEYQFCPDWYENALDFGESSSWYDLLKNYYIVIPNSD